MAKKCKQHHSVVTVDVSETQSNIKFRDKLGVTLDIQTPAEKVFGPPKYT